MHVTAQKLVVFHVRTGMEQERSCVSCQPGSEVSSALSREISKDTTTECLEMPRESPVSRCNYPDTPVISVQSRAKNPHLVVGKVRRVKGMMRRACD